MQEHVILDVSRHQGRMNWEIAKKNGCVLGFARSTVGNYYCDRLQDEEMGANYLRNIQGMKDAGIKTGTYLVITKYQTAQQHFEYFKKYVNRDDLDAPVVVDDELGAPPLEVSKLLDLTSDWYGEPSFHYGNKSRMRYLAILRQSWMDDYRRFLAWYTSSLDAGLPWDLWQYSADGNYQGRRFGAESQHIDISRYNGDLLEWLGVDEKPPVLGNLDAALEGQRLVWQEIEKLAKEKLEELGENDGI